MSPQALIPAAEYVRMSTEDQPNSIDFQKEAIRQYAAVHNFQVITSYEDPARSGVEIKHRPALRQLIQDVLNDEVTFRAILVYDVSRWGRFQDTDESACYEFLCRAAGVPIHYCAEQFQNDLSVSSSVLKNVKRTMAAEYSRELGVKIRAAQRLVASRGFRPGGVPGYGFRRMLVSADGRKKQVLNLNDRKSVSSDHVVLVPGPRHEIECVRRIFDLAAHKKNTPLSIAHELNRRGFKFVNGKPWSEASVYRMLKNAKYIGHLTWGRTHKYKVCASENWVRTPNAFPPLITLDQFKRAQRAMAKRTTWPPRPDRVVLDEMKEVLHKEGRISEKLLHQYRHFGYRRYIARLGSVIRAYEMIGYCPPDRVLHQIESAKKIKQLRSNLLTELKTLFPSQIRVIWIPGQPHREVVEIENTICVAIHICRPSESTMSGEPRWVVLPHPSEKGLPALICTCSKNLDHLTSFHVLPQIPELPKGGKIVGESHPLLRSGQRLNSLSHFCEIVKMVIENSHLENDVTRLGDVVFTERSATITIGNRDLFLPVTAASFFKLLVNNAGKTISRHSLREVLRAAAQPTQGSSGLMDRRLNHKVSYHIWQLRSKLGNFRRRIVNVKGEGFIYRDGVKVNPQFPLDMRQLAGIAVRRKLRQSLGN